MPIVPKSLQNTLNPILKRIQRSSLYYGHYNNTLEFPINFAYSRYVKECAKAYAKKNGSQTFAPSPVMTECAQVVKGIMDKKQAAAYSETITKFIKDGHPCITQLPGYEGLMQRIDNPLEHLGEEILDIFKTPQLHEAIVNFFHGDYRIEWVSGMRTTPSDKKIAAWKWHSDSFPHHTCKLFLHLTPVSGDSGATQFLSPKDTFAYRKAGYFGQYKEDRLEDLTEFAKQHNLPHRPYHLDADAGDGSLFNMNFFHRAIAPVHGYRDVIEFYLLPNPIPWDEQLKQNGGIESLHCDDHHYYPKNPLKKR